MIKLGKIVLIDDDESFSDLAKQFLEEEGFTVICAENGEEGIEKIEEECPDLVLLDVMMPGIDGWTVYQQIQSIKSDVEIAFLTALEKMPSMDKFNISDYIVKRRPFKKEKLVKRVRNILE